MPTIFTATKSKDNTPCNKSTSFKVIVRKSDKSHADKVQELAKHPFVSAVAKEVNDNEIAKWNAQLRINKWVEDHYNERIGESEDGKKFYIPFRLPDGQGIRDSKVCVILTKENYVEEWRNVGSEHHWISCHHDLGHYRLDWYPTFFADILENQDRIEQLREDYIAVGILHR